MKKIISLIVVLTLAVSSVLCIHAANGANILTMSAIELSGLSDEISNMLKDKIENGETIYYGQGTTNPDYLNENVKTRGIPTDRISLPSGGGFFSFDMEYGNVYYSPYLLYAESACTMKLYRTCTVKNDPCNINLQVFDKTTDTMVFSNDLYVDETGATLSIPLSATHEYYIITAPLTAGESHVTFVVSGE